VNYQLFRTTTLALVAVVAFAADPKIAPDLGNADPTSAANVIVQFTQSPTAFHHKKITDLGGVYRDTYAHVNAGSYSIPVSALGTLAKDRDVVYISPDRSLHGVLDNTTNAVNAPAAWSAGYTGAGVGVAVIDSGITNSGDMPGSTTVYGYSYINFDFNDYYGHGSHVAGIIAGNGQRSHCFTCFRNLQGVAPGASLINIRVLDQNGSGNDSTVIAAIEQVILLKPVYNIRVLNLSLGRPIYESYLLDPLCIAVEAAWKAGIVVVVAAGNDGRDNSAGNNGYGTIMAPGNDPYVITVGAMRTMGTYTRTDDAIASYSSKGPTAIDHIVKPDVVAPGNQVVSLYSPLGTMLNTYPANAVTLGYFMTNGGTINSNQYFTLSGTSMATPVVSGAAALLLQAQPTLTPDQVKAKFMLTAYKNLPKTSTATDPVTGQTYTSQSDAFTVGAGYLDIAAALADKNTFTGTANSPVATYNSTTQTTGVVCSPTSICASSAVWGTTSVWGTSSIWGTSAVWGANSVWGTSAIWGTSAVWGTSSIWGTSATSAESAQSGTIGTSGDK
jgi:serine protease AprX